MRIHRRQDDVSGNKSPLCGNAAATVEAAVAPGAAVDAAAASAEFKCPVRPFVDQNCDSNMDKCHSLVVVVVVIVVVLVFRLGACGSWSLTIVFRPPKYRQTTRTTSP